MEGGKGKTVRLHTDIYMHIYIRLIFNFIIIFFTLGSVLAFSIFREMNDYFSARVHKINLFPNSKISKISLIYNIRILFFFLFQTTAIYIYIRSYAKINAFTI